MNGAPPHASVIIPAHNEGAVIERCLRALTADAAAGELDVIVVVNASTDDTAERACRMGVRVLETPVGGKAHAIRLGDAAARTFPRLYLDADVVVDTASVRALVEALDQPGVLACAPRPVLDLDTVGTVARRVHRVHERLVEPYRVLAGAGLYALGAAGNARAFPLPEIVADDEWVHRSFAPHERRGVNEARSVIRPAASVRAHLRRRARVRFGNDQLRKLGRPRTDAPLRLSALRSLIRARTISPLDALCYLAVTASDRGAAAVRRARGRDVEWPSQTGNR